MRLLRSLLALGLVAGAAAAEDATLAEQIMAKAQAYEQSLAEPYQAVEPGLERWYEGQRQQIVDHLHALLAAQTTPETRLFVAFHLLGVQPADAAAREAFRAANVTPPIDEQGAPVGTFTMAAPVTASLAEEVARGEHPSFDTVAAAFTDRSPLVAGFFARQHQSLLAMRDQLISMTRHGQDHLIYQLLAYYWSGEKHTVHFYHSLGRPVPTSPWYVDPVDEFLIDHELMGRDFLQTTLIKPKWGPPPTPAADHCFTVPDSTWDFGYAVRSAQVEAIVVPGPRGLPGFQLGEDGPHGGVLVLIGAKGDAKKVSVLSLPSHREIAHGEAVAGMTGPTPVEITVRDRSCTVAVGGIPAATGTLPQACLLQRFSIEGHDVLARQLNVRFINTHPRAATALATPPPAPAPPVAPAWAGERERQLAQTIAVHLDETPIADAIVAIGRSAKVTITLDDSAQPLKDVPVSLEATGLTLASVFEHLQRMTDLKATPTADGFSLTWTK